MNDFIEVYEKAFTDDYCDKAIECMEKAIDSGYGSKRFESDGSPKTMKDDYQLFSYDLLCANTIFDPDLHREFNDVFWNYCYADYRSKYSALNEIDVHAVYGNKLQKTGIGQGYHVWHSEHSKAEKGRVLLYIVYLNDVGEGGETEFLYQHKRIKPTKGTVIIAPAGFTHTHRGNPPLSNTKYIMTGWVEY